MFKKGRIILLSILSAISLGSIVVASLAWFGAARSIPEIDIDGTSKGAYFAYGDGSSDNPFGIRTPRQLYNLAWLQYWGMFNRDTNPADGTIDKQYYFELDANINMSGWELPPIGTDEYPFLGEFNGNNYTISNLTVSNQDTFDRKPSAIDYNEQPEIVGFFGVVGECQTNLGYTYDSSVVCLKNTTLSNLTIHSETTNTLVGLAAGYVNASNGLSNVKIGEATIDIDGCKPISEITSNLSDYSLIGYCTSTGSVSNFSKKVSENVHKSVSGGSDGGFGASVNFKEYNDWIFDLHKRKQYDIIDSSKVADKGFMEANTSSSYWSRYNKKAGTNYNLVFNSPVGTKDPDAVFGFVKNSAQSSSPYYFDYTFNLFDYNSETGLYSGTYSETNGTSSSYGQVANINITSSARKTHTYSSNTRYYYSITFASAASRFGNVTSMVLYQSSSGSANYIALKADSVNGSVNPNTTANRLWSTNSFIFYDQTVYHLTNDNYIPLKFSDTKSGVAGSNTGYIIGTGLASDTNNYGAASPRIASYSSEYLSNSVSNGTISSIYTYDINETSNNKWKTISETKDSSGKVTGTTNITFESGKYNAARNAVGTIIEGQNTIHGIHFDVSASSTYATGYYRGSIYGGDAGATTKTMLLKSYNGVAQSTKMPKGGINFELEDSGYITFFAGMYNVTSTVSSLNFFSLFEVDRTSPTAYTLKEIKKVYKSENWSSQNPSYVYMYTTDNDTPSGVGDLVFDIENALWPARPKDNSLYYFEIPVNGGEYVMGAVNQSHTSNTAYQGAYMMYLDIGSNGKSLGDNVMDAQKIETTPTSASYPQGVDFDITNLSSTGGNTSCLSIGYTTGTITGSLSFTVGSAVSADAKDITTCSIVYKKNSSVIDVSSSTETIGDLSGSSGLTTRLIKVTITEQNGTVWNIDYNDSSGTYTKIIKDGLDVTAQGGSTIPSIFNDNLSDIRSALIAVDMVFTGTDFSITNITYSGTRVSIEVPTAELGSKTFSVTYPSGNYNSLYINGSTYPAS